MQNVGLEPLRDIEPFTRCGFKYATDYRETYYESVFNFNKDDEEELT